MIWRLTRMLRSYICLGVSIFFVFITNAPAVADQKSKFCPEQDFVDICLVALDSLKGVVDWAGKNKGWHALSFKDPLLQSGIWVTSGGHDRFTIKETSFSDATVFQCHRHTINPIRPGSVMNCTNEFPIIERQLPRTAVRQDFQQDDGSSVHYWTYEIGRERAAITVRQYPGKSKLTSFGVTKVLLKRDLR